MLYTLILLSAVGALRFAASFHFTHAFRIPRISTSLFMSEEVAVEEGKQEVEITSKEIVRLQRKIEELTANINATVAMKQEVNEEYKRMDEEVYRSSTPCQSPIF